MLIPLASAKPKLSSSTTVCLDVASISPTMSISPVCNPITLLDSSGTERKTTFFIFACPPK